MDIQQSLTYLNQAHHKFLGNTNLLVAFSTEELNGLTWHVAMLYSTVRNELVFMGKDHDATRLMATVISGYTKLYGEPPEEPSSLAEINPEKLAAQFPGLRAVPELHLICDPEPPPPPPPPAPAPEPDVMVAVSPEAVDAQLASAEEPAPEPAPE